MNLLDPFIAGVSLLLGLLMLSTGLLDMPRQFSFWIGRTIVNRLGENWGRAFYALLGLVLIGMALSIFFEALPL